jgi:hypothetical protein
VRVAGFVGSRKTGARREKSEEMVRTLAPSGREQQHRLHLPNLHLPHGLVCLPRRLSPWIEPWFLTILELRGEWRRLALTR